MSNINKKSKNQGDSKEEIDPDKLKLLEEYKKNVEKEKAEAKAKAKKSNLLRSLSHDDDAELFNAILPDEDGNSPVHSDEVSNTWDTQGFKAAVKKARKIRKSRKTEGGKRRRKRTRKKRGGQKWFKNYKAFYEKLNKLNNPTGKFYLVKHKQNSVANMQKLIEYSDDGNGVYTFRFEPPIQHQQPQNPIILQVFDNDEGDESEEVQFAEVFSDNPFGIPNRGVGAGGGKQKRKTKKKRGAGGSSKMMPKSIERKPDLFIRPAPEGTYDEQGCLEGNPPQGIITNWNAGFNKRNCSTIGPIQHMPSMHQDENHNLTIDDCKCLIDKETRQRVDIHGQRYTGHHTSNLNNPQGMNTLFNLGQKDVIINRDNIHRDNPLRPYLIRGMKRNHPWREEMEKEEKKKIIKVYAVK